MHLTSLNAIKLSQVAETQAAAARPPASGPTAASRAR